MKTTFAAIVVFFMMAIPLCSAQSALVVNIESVKQEFSSTKAMPISFTLRNVSLASMEIEAGCSFELYKDSGVSYMAPFDLGTLKPIGPNATLPEVILKADATSTVLIDIATLNWGESIRSVWPHELLKQVVPPGIYKLRLYAGRGESPSIEIKIKE